MRKLVLLLTVIGAMLYSNAAFCQGILPGHPIEVIAWRYDEDGELSQGSIKSYEYEFDGKGNVVALTENEVIGDEPYMSSSSEYSYDDENRVVRSLSEYVYYGMIEGTSESKYTYDKNGNTVLYESNKLVGSEMKPDAKTELVHDENNNRLETRFYQYQDNTETYELQGIETCSYNDDNLLEAETMTPEAGSGWQFSKTEYNYDEYQNLSCCVSYRKSASDQEWDLENITQYSHNEFGICEEIQDNVLYENTSKYVYAYDNEGRLVDKSSYYWDTETEDWCFGTIRTYSYDDQSATIETETVPEPLLLTRNFPNPFNPVTTIEYTVPDDLRGTVTLAVYDARGALVRTLVQEEARPGVHSAVWDATDRQGGRVSNGVYFCRVQAGSTVQSHKMLLLK